MSLIIVPRTTSVVASSDELPLVSVNDMDVLADSARKTFQIFEPWSQAEFTVENDLLKDIVGFIKMQSGSYCRALTMSLRTSRNCVMLSDGATSLCSGIAEGRDQKELSASIDLLLEITRSGTEQAEEVVHKFRAVRQGLFQLTSRIPYAVEQVTFEHQVCEASKKRYQRAHKHLGRVHRAFAGITESIVPVVAPLISAAIPGLGVVLPVALPLATLAAGKAAEQARSMVEKRETQQLACTDAIKHLEAISNDIGEVIEHVGKFTAWWQDMEFTFRNLQSRIESSSESSSWDTSQLTLTKERFAEIGQRNRNYISDITRLQDFFPKLVENDGFHKRITSILPQDDLPQILRAMTKSTNQYYSAYHRLQVSSGEAKTKYRAGLEKQLEAVRQSLHVEVNSLHDILRCLSRAARSQYDDRDAQEIRYKLGILLEKADTTRSTFEGCKDEVSSMLPSHHSGRRSRRHDLHRQLSVIMNGLVSTVEDASPLTSLEHAIQQQNASIQDLVRYFNSTISSITYSAIAYIGDSDGQKPVEFWQFDRIIVTESLDKVSVSVDSLAKPQMALLTY